MDVRVQHLEAGDHQADPYRLEPVLQRLAD
jgi:hypothetical protein